MELYLGFTGFYCEKLGKFDLVGSYEFFTLRKLREFFVRNLQKFRCEVLREFFKKLSKWGLFHATLEAYAIYFIAKTNNLSQGLKLEFLKS